MEEAGGGAKIAREIVCRCTRLSEAGRQSDVVGRTELRQQGSGRTRLVNRRSATSTPSSYHTCLHTTELAISRTHKGHKSQHILAERERKWRGRMSMNMSTNHTSSRRHKKSARATKRSSSQNTKYRTHTRTHQTKKKVPPEQPAQHVGDHDRPCLGHTYPGKVALGPTDRATITTGSEARKTQVTAALRSSSGHVYCPRFRVEKIAHTNIRRPEGRETSPVEGWREYELARLVFQVGYEGGFVVIYPQEVHAQTGPAA